MGRVEPDALGDPEDVYLADSLASARRVEALLTEHGVDYAVQVETLGRTTLFGSLRHGAAFYVSSGQAGYCRSVLANAGLTRGLIEDQNAATGD